MIMKIKKKRTKCGLLEVFVWVHNSYNRYVGLDMQYVLEMFLFQDTKLRKW